MTGIIHHIPGTMLLSYASGTLAQPFSLVVAAHVSLCDECRVRLAAHETAGGGLLEETAPEELSDGLRARVLAGLDSKPPETRENLRSGIFPGPVMQMLGGDAPAWKSLGTGARQAILSDGPDGSTRLLQIPAGQAVPDHGHNGLELTLVLEGAFRDETGRFGPGDVEVADAELEHTPTAEPDGPCICLAATDAPLRFTAWLPRLLQPLFRI